MERKLPDGWVWTTLNEISDSLRDGTHNPPKRMEEGIPLLSARNIKAGYIDWDEDFSYISGEDYQTIRKNNSIEIDDVLLTIVGSIGRAYVNRCERAYTVQRSVAIIRPSIEKIIPQYLCHYLNSPKTQAILNNEARGVAQKGVYLGTIGKMKIPLPPLDTQQKIVTTLNNAEKTKRLRAQANELTQKLLQSVFLEMFGDPGKNSMGWDIHQFGDYCAMIRYGIGTPPKFSDHGVPFIRATNIKGGDVIEQDLKFVSEEEAKTIEKCRVKEGDLIIVRSGANTGDSTYIRKRYDGALAAYDLIVELRSIDDAPFFNHLINSSFGQEQIELVSRRAGQPHLNAEQLYSLKFAIPPKRLRETFSRFANHVESLTLFQRQASTECEKLFNNILSRAFTGDLVA